MCDEMWRPVVPTGREEALVEEFPDYLREAVFEWMRDQFALSMGSVDSEWFVSFQNSLRVNLGFQSGQRWDWRSGILPYLRKLDDATFTNLVDYFASQYQFSDYRWETTEHPLEIILSEGGSAWTVVPWNEEYARLVKRVPDGVRQAVQPVLHATDIASRKLQEAWVDAYGPQPRASVAYSNAVVAVETAALSVIPVTKKDATLASLFSILEAETPTWCLILRDSDKAPGAKSLAAMLRTLWRGHQSRHGRPDYADATLEEARAAVILAATLVQWFGSGVVREVW